MAKPEKCVGSDNLPKDRFPTRWQAQRQLQWIWRRAAKGKQRSPFLPCRVYKCKKCKGYHLTSSAQRKPPQRNR